MQRPVHILEGVRFSRQSVPTSITVLKIRMHVVVKKGEARDVRPSRPRDNVIINEHDGCAQPRSESRLLDRRDESMRSVVKLGRRIYLKVGDDGFEIDSLAHARALSVQGEV